MKDIMEDYYKPRFLEMGFSFVPNPTNYCKIGATWELSKEIGKGTYWIYSQKDLFDITIHDFYFHEDTCIDFQIPECLNITQYESISGEELSPYRRLEAGTVKSLIGGYEHYRFRIHKKVPIRSIGIEILPAYYEDYLKHQFPTEYLNPLNAFAAIDQTSNFPEMSRLLQQVKNYRGEGMAAKLFYEGKVAEAVSLVVERNKALSQKTEHLKNFSSQDLKQISTVTAFLNDHYAQDITIDELTKIACMSATKLQTSFKQYHSCTITEYMQQRRMSQAEYLLSATDLNIGQIAQTVGYTKASRFSELFRKSTGLLPSEYRKITHGECE